MATVTNKTLNTETTTNKVISSTTLTWGEADFTWGEGSGTWENPHSLDNKAANEAAVTNKAQS